MSRTVDHESQPKESVFTRSLHGLNLRVPDDFADSPHEFCVCEGPAVCQARYSQPAPTPSCGWQ
jgi:hypothetical protein